MKNLLKTLGPGILFASTAIGVSHLIQSTQAGGNFGFTMLWAILLANIFKYPFFEFGSRYANATGKSIISGYSKLGRPVLWIYFIITLVSMFLVTAAVGNVTAGFMQNLFNIESGLITVTIIFLISIFILIANNFNLLDKLIKIIGIVLLISTLAAFVLVLINGPVGERSLMSMDGIPKEAYWVFLIPLMGWMPTALDLSAWNSLWTVERIKQTNYHPKLKETLWDFNFGYIISALLALCFLTLGAYLMFGTGKTFSNSGVKFSGEVIDLYVQTFGDWSNIIISASAFSIMFGTCIAVFDGYSRAMSACLIELSPSRAHKLGKKKLYQLVLIIMSIGSFLLIMAYQGEHFIALVILATSVSFVIAPFIAVFNLLLVREKHVGKSFVPKLWLRVLAYLGIGFLVLFTLFYLFIDYFLSML